MTKEQYLKKFIAEDEVLQDITERLGLDESENPIALLESICEHGLVSGFTGFIYYDETNEFFDKWEDEIWDHFEATWGLENMLEELARGDKLDARDILSENRYAKNYYCWAYVEDRISRLLDMINYAIEDPDFDNEDADDIG